MKSITHSRYKLMILLLSLLWLTSCTDYVDLSQEVAGEYEGYVVNGLYTFDINVLEDGSDEVVIDAIFDDLSWERIRVDLDQRSDGNIHIDIYGQNVYGGARIWGVGIWDNGFLQLDYTIDWGVELVQYRMIGNQYY